MSWYQLSDFSVNLLLCFSPLSSHSMSFFLPLLPFLNSALLFHYVLFPFLFIPKEVLRLLLWCHFCYKPIQTQLKIKNSSGTEVSTVHTDLAPR